MSDLTQFTFNEYDVRTVVLDGEPWFVLADLASVLGLARRPAAIAERLEDDVRQAYPIEDSLGRTQQTIIVSEAGMYDVIVRSDSPLAAPFRRWITTEVLPSIRKTGSYGAPAQLTGPELMAAALIEAQETLAAHETRIAQLAPKASRWDTFLEATGDYSMRDAAQILSRDHGIKVGQNRLATWLRENGWIDKRGIPYQHRIDAAHLKAKPRTYRHPRTGEDVAADPQVRITTRGLDLLVERIGGPRLEAI